MTVTAFKNHVAYWTTGGPPARTLVGARSFADVNRSVDT